jgi:hypothetical protein
MNVLRNGWKNEHSPMEEGRGSEGKEKGRGSKGDRHLEKGKWKREQTTRGEGRKALKEVRKDPLAGQSLSQWTRRMAPLLYLPHASDTSNKCHYARLLRSDDHEDVGRYTPSRLDNHESIMLSTIHGMVWTLHSRPH